MFVQGVVAAARGLINLYRVINPAYLDRKDRGKDGQMNLESRKPKVEFLFLFLLFFLFP